MNAVICLNALNAHIVSVLPAKNPVPKSLPSIPPFSYKRNTTLFSKGKLFTQTTKDIFQNWAKPTITLTG
jgi:hypothetical protein